MRLHTSAGFAHAVGAPQQTEFGAGGGGTVGAEVATGKVVGFQAELSALSLAPGSAPSGSRLAQPEAGNGLGGMLGVRFHPFGSVVAAGLWGDVNAGVMLTGNAARPAFDAHVGYDWRLAPESRWDVGPFLGYTEVFEPSPALLPGPAHILFAGVHVAFGVGGRARPAGNLPSALPSRGEAASRVDPDHDGLLEVADACPGARGAALPDPYTNRCPRSDRDNDTVADVDDACPDVPGISTLSAATNGCPPRGDRVRLEGDTIVLDDVVHFDVDSPRVSGESHKVLQRLADFLKATPDITEMDVDGHADETGTNEYNLALSRDRAADVKRLLVKQGVDASRLTTRAYGESRPRAPGHAEAALRQNRRVELTVTRARARSSEVPLHVSEPPGSLVTTGGGS